MSEVIESEVIDHTEKPEATDHTEKPEVTDQTEKPDFFESAMKYLIILEKFNNITLSFAKQMMFG